MTTAFHGTAETDRLASETGDWLQRIVAEECAKAFVVTGKVNDLAGDVVTQTDYHIQNRLQDVLQRLLPEADFVGEEEYASRNRLSDAPHWIVDPLDGTLNFASGLPFFGASVALVVGRMPVIGLVYDAGARCIYQATASGPALENGVSFRWNNDRAERAPVAISSGFLALMRSEPARYGPSWLGSRFRILGSQAVQLCWAASGKLRLNINPEAKLWDDAAGALICERAGAAHASLECGGALYPLQVGSPALQGHSIFSLAGHPVEVNRSLNDFVNH